MGEVWVVGAVCGLWGSVGYEGSVSYRRCVWVMGEVCGLWGGLWVMGRCVGCGRGVLLMGEVCGLWKRDVDYGGGVCIMREMC